MNAIIYPKCTNTKLRVHDFMGHTLCFATGVSTMLLVPFAYTWKASLNNWLQPPRIWGGEGVGVCRWFLTSTRIQCDRSLSNDLLAMKMAAFGFSVAHKFQNYVNLSAFQPTQECVVVTRYHIATPVYQCVWRGTHNAIYKFNMIWCTVSFYNLQL